MSEKRLNDFRASRYCSKMALLKLGIRCFPILINQHRAPVWPENIVGSLTHCENQCLAVVARTKDVRSIGVDIERINPIKKELISIICTKAEQRQLDMLNNPTVAAKIMFSIKESIFKCLHPIVEQWIDFKDVSLELNFKELSYQASPIRCLQERIGISSLSGRWDSNNNWIYSSCWLDQQSK